MSICKGIKELLDVDVLLKRSQLFFKIVDVGTKAKLLLLDETVFDIDTTKFRKDCIKFYVTFMYSMQHWSPNSKSPFQWEFDPTYIVLESKK